MAKEFVKSGASLVDVSSDKIRNFACLEDVRAAIANGELVEGDMFTTICQTTGCTEDIAQELCRIASYIPATTSPTNQLLNHDTVAEIEGDIVCRVQCCDYNTYTAANDACMNCRVQCCDFNDFVTATNNNKVSCNDYTTCIGSIDAAIACRVQCCDYNANVTCVNNRLTAIENVSIPDLDTCICCAEERLTCLEARADVLENITVDPSSGLVTTVSDLSADYHSCCTSWNNSITTLNGKAGLDCVGTVTSIKQGTSTYSPDANGLVTIPAVDTSTFIDATCAGTIANDCIALHAGVDCTGTLVASDLDTINTCIACLKACPGLNCTGTVTGSKVSCSDYESCCSNWNTCISCLKACAGLDCTGTLRSSDLDDYATKSCVKTIVNGIFSLSGNTLTITSA